jgi:YD repeat-containing protein
VRPLIGFLRQWLLALLTASALSTPDAATAQSPPREKHWAHIDVSLGRYAREDEDLIVPGPLPMVLTRTYLSGYRIAKQFGIGTTHSGEWYLIGKPGEFKWAELVLHNGGRIHFDRVSEGDTIENAAFRSTDQLTNFKGSHLRRDRGTWALEFDDGGLARFQSCEPGEFDECALIELRNAEGDRIEYVRNRSGLLLSMRSSDRHITFEYDDRRRVVAARDNSGRRVSYAYDDRGRLRRVSTWDGVVRSYTYSDNDEMLTIDEGGKLVENTFDSDGRIVHQRTSRGNQTEPYTLDFEYKVSDGRVVHADLTESGVGVTRHHIDASRTTTAITYNPDTVDQITVTYGRDGSLTNGITVECLGADGPVVRFAPATHAVLQDVKWLVITRECRAGREALRFRD